MALIYPSEDHILDEEPNVVVKLGVSAGFLVQGAVLLGRLNMHQPDIRVCRDKHSADVNDRLDDIHQHGHETLVALITGVPDPFVSTKPRGYKRLVDHRVIR